MRPASREAHCIREQSPVPLRPCHRILHPRAAPTGCIQRPYLRQQLFRVFRDIVSAISGRLPSAELCWHHSLNRPSLRHCFDEKTSNGNLCRLEAGAYRPLCQARHPEMLFSHARPSSVLFASQYGQRQRSYPSLIQENFPTLAEHPRCIITCFSPNPLKTKTTPRQNV